MKRQVTGCDVQASIWPQRVNTGRWRSYRLSMQRTGVHGQDREDLELNMQLGFKGETFVSLLKKYL